MAKVFVSRKIPGSALDRLTSSEHEIKTSEFGRPLKAEEFLERAKGSDAVLSLLTDKIDAEVIDAIDKYQQLNEKLYYLEEDFRVKRIPPKRYNLLRSIIIDKIGHLIHITYIQHP